MRCSDCYRSAKLQAASLAADATKNRKARGDDASSGYPQTWLDDSDEGFMTARSP